MTTPPDEGKSSRALDNFSEVLQAGAEHRMSEDLDPGLNVLLARVAAGKPHRRKVFRWTVVVVAKSEAKRS